MVIWWRIYESIARDIENKYTELFTFRLVRDNDDVCRLFAINILLEWWFAASNMVDKHDPPHHVGKFRYVDPTSNCVVVVVAGFIVCE